MNSYWVEHYTESALIHSESPLKQVGKTVNGVEVNQKQILVIINHIVSALGLSPNDVLLDYGCGNGLLTYRLAEYANKVIGVDFTENLLNFARKHHSRANIMYYQDDILTFSTERMRDVNRYMMYEVLQHLNSEQLVKLLHNLQNKPQGTLFFIGGIPDHKRLRVFYDSAEKYQYYLNCEESGKPHLGRWWYKSELLEIAKNTGFSIKILAQPEGLYTSHYRFDALLEKVY